MTREEAIAKLKEKRQIFIDEWADLDDIVEAFDMAISALEQISQIRKAIVEAEEENLHLSYPVWCFMRKIEKIVGKKEMGEFEQEPCRRKGHYNSCKWCNSCKWYDEDLIYNPNCENCCHNYEDNYWDAEMT